MYIPPCFCDRAGHNVHPLRSEFRNGQLFVDVKSCAECQSSDELQERVRELEREVLLHRRRWEELVRYIIRNR